MEKTSNVLETSNVDYDLIRERLEKMKSELGNDIKLVSLSSYCESNGLGDYVGILLDTVIDFGGDYTNPTYTWMSDDVSINEVIKCIDDIHNDVIDTRPYQGADSKIVAQINKLGGDERDYKIFRYLQILSEKADGSKEFILDNFFNKYNVHDYIRKVLVENHLKNLDDKENPRWEWTVGKPTIKMAQKLHNTILNAKNISFDEPTKITKSKSKKKESTEQLEQKYLEILTELKKQVDTGKMKSYDNFRISHDLTYDIMKIIEQKCLIRLSVYSWIAQEPNTKLARSILVSSGLDYASNKRMTELKTNTKKTRVKHTKEFILTESNYDKFRFFSINRAIKQKKLEAIIESINKIGYQNSKAILVYFDGEHFWIIDGQHRFRASKFFGLPIKYVLFVGTREEAVKTIIYLNISQSDYNTDDWINTYASEEYPEYIRLKKLTVTYKNLSRANIMLIGSNYRTKMHKGNVIKDGVLEFHNNHIERLDFLQTFGDKLNNIKLDRNMVETVVAMYDKNLLEESFERLIMNAGLINKRASTDDYKRQFEEIINKNKRQENRISLI